MMDTRNALAMVGWMRAGLASTSVACIILLGCDSGSDGSNGAVDASTRNTGVDSGAGEAIDSATSFVIPDVGLVGEIDSSQAEDGSAEMVDADIDGATEASDGGPMMNGDGGMLVDIPLPHDGTRLSICYDSSECMTDDLVCYRPDAARPGFCTEDCSMDTDCQPIGGMAATCSPERQCRVDCTGSGTGDGACPTNMTCRNVSAVILAPLYRCTYAPEAGMRTAGPYERCDLTHGDGDCESGLTCLSPGGLITGPVGPGYCAPRCELPTECQVPVGVTSTPICSANVCTLDCSVAGGTCPMNMNCRDIDDAQLITTYRCRFIQ